MTIDPTVHDAAVTAGCAAAHAVVDSDYPPLLNCQIEEIAIAAVNAALPILVAY